MPENSILCRLDLSAIFKLVACVGHSRKAATVAIAATVLVAITITCVLHWRGTYATEGSEWRTVSLKDGSVARLGPRTEIKEKFDGKMRYIVQFSGEATYDVVKDANRPFVVICGMARVEAIGTKFAVKCDQDIVVTVAEGTVSVSRGLAQSHPVPSVDYVRAEAGQQVLVNLWTQLTPRPVDLKAALAWERGRIFFPGTPIEQALAEFNRRHKQQIALPRVYDPNYQVFGEFDLEDPEAFIQFLKTSPAMQPR